MDKHILPKFVITSIAIISVFCSAVFISVCKADVAGPAAENQDELYKQSRDYRQAGVENQRMGNLTEAMGFYQKAVALDPSYAQAYNDLGVIYEAMGYPQRAQESYLKAVKIDPGYVSVYTNLALLSESQRDLEKAVFYWDKRAQLGSAGDPWTQKAVDRLRDIRIVLSKQPISDLREEEVLGLMDDVSANKIASNKDDKALSRNHFQKAKESYKKGDLAAAIKEALDAQYLDQDNPEIEAFIEKAQLRVLSK